MRVAPSLERMVEDSRTAAAAFMPSRPGYPFVSERQSELALALIERLWDIAGLALHASLDGMDFVRGRPERPKLKQALRLRPTIKSDPHPERP